jgi:endogenous inhibitor of DNA gyrase (YacG/DUF329 family)
MCKRILENAPDDHPARPFCSPNCKLADLHNWLGGRYRIETDEDPSEDLGQSSSGSSLDS